MSDILNQQPMPRKAKAKLQRLLQNKEISAEGLAWLINTTDPFHDSPNASVGMPRGLGTKTVKKWIRKEVTVTMPTGLTEMSVFVTPLEWLYNYTTANDESLITGNRTGAGRQCAGAPPGSATIKPGVNVVLTGPQGNLFTSALSQAVAGTTLSASDWDTSGSGEIVAMAFEVHDVTPKLSDGGAVTMWRIPASKSEPSSTMTSTGAALAPSTQIMCTGLPGSLKDLSNNPENVTLEAKRGAYVVALKQMPENGKPRMEAIQGVYFFPNGTGATGPCFFVNVDQANLQGNIVGDWAFGGAWFSGLTPGGGANPPSQLNIIAKYLIEEVCSPTDPTFPFATPAGPYDPLALEMYTRCLDEMPPGCAVDENPLGEWFNSLMDTVSEYAPKVLSAIPVVGGLVGAGVSTLAGTAASINRKLQEEEKKKASPPPKPPAKKTGAQRPKRAAPRPPPKQK